MMNCLQALQKQSQTLTAEAQHLGQQLQMLQKDVQDKQQLHKCARYKSFLNCCPHVDLVQHAYFAALLQGSVCSSPSRATNSRG